MRKYMDLKPRTRKQELETIMLSRKGKRIVVSEPHTSLTSPSFMQDLIFTVQKSQRSQMAAMRRDGFDNSDSLRDDS